jgi:hypothetical protein
MEVDKRISSWEFFPQEYNSYTLNPISEETKKKKLDQCNVKKSKKTCLSFLIAYNLG